MFDFSFGEIFVIAVVAVIFLGPDKLPQTFVKIAKFLRAVKKTINDAKDTLDREIHITEMKQDALEYKKKFADSAEKLKNEILQDADVEGIKREIEGAKSAAILNESLEKSSISFDEVESKGKAVQARLKSNLKQKNAESSGNSSLGASCVDLADFGHCADSSLALRPKSVKNSTTSTANTRICNLDSANQTQNAESTTFCHSKSFSCHSERSEESKNNSSLRADSQNLRGKPPLKKTQILQQGLPRSHSLARNDEILDSSLRLRSAQNDKNSVRVAESSKKPKKSSLDSAKAKSKTTKKSPKCVKNEHTKANGSE